MGNALTFRFIAHNNIKIKKYIGFDILEDCYKSIQSIPVFIENIGHMGAKSNVREIPKILELIDEREEQ